MVSLIRVIDYHWDHSRTSGLLISPVPFSLSRCFATRLCLHPLFTYQNKTGARYPRLLQPFRHETIQLRALLGLFYHAALLFGLVSQRMAEIRVQIFSSVLRSPKGAGTAANSEVGGMQQGTLKQHTATCFTFHTRLAICFQCAS